MKKRNAILSSVLAGAMLLSLTACGGTDDSSSSSAAETGDSSSAAATGEASGEALGADTQAIVDRGILRVGVKNAVVGFGYQDPATGEYSGMEIELAKKLADQLGVDVEFTTVTAATRTELLDSGDIDCVLATFTITDERKQSWDFTTPYYTDYVTVLVEDSSGITSLADLKGKLVGVSSGSTSARSLVEAMIEDGDIEGTGFSADTFDPATWTDGVTFQQFDDYPAMAREAFNAMFSVDGEPQRPLVKRMMPIVRKRGLLRLAGEVRKAVRSL